VRSETNSRSPKSRRAKSPKRIWIVDLEGHMVTYCEIWVEALWENMIKKSLKLPKPKQLKQPRTVDLREDTCHQMEDSG
jgi:hypothetical protein